MKEREKTVYTKEELSEHVRVPAVVEKDLKRIISDRLEQCGLYFRVFSRIKTATSMARKFEMKEYGEDRKLQDAVYTVKLFTPERRNLFSEIVDSAHSKHISFRRRNSAQSLRRGKLLRFSAS